MSVDGLLLGFCTVLWISVPVFWRNVLPPFSVDIELGEKQESCRNGGRIGLVVLSTSHSSDWPYFL